MTTPLLSLTQLPVQYSTFEFGGDDTQTGRSGLMGRITEWDLDENKSCFVANFIFVVKKLFDFLDAMGIGTCFFGMGGFKGKMREYEYYLTGLERNRAAREAIVHALGGEEVCRGFRTVALNASDFTGYIKLSDTHFNSGESIIQAEDPAGRKLVALRLTHRASGAVYIATVHQRMRETCIHHMFRDGSRWTVNFSPDLVAPEIDHPARFIHALRDGRNEMFALTPKP